MEISQKIVQSIRRRTFRLTVSASNADGTLERWTATAFCFGVLKPNMRPVVATARHVLDFRPGADVTIQADRFDDDDNLSSTVTIRCGSDCTERPLGFYKLSDIGFIYLPANDDAGAPVFRPDEAPLPVIGDNLALTTGSWVAWAGFAGQIERFLGRPQLSFFQGTVSAFAKRTDREGHAYYIIDGHASPGVSGGPVWEVDPKGGFHVVGIVSRIAREDNGIPGFCCFEPINPLVVFAKSRFRGGAGGSTG